MNFTDDDLKRVQNELDHSDEGYWLTRLLARLNAAESCVELLKLHQEAGNIFDGDEQDDALALQALEAWHKAAGK